MTTDEQVTATRRDMIETGQPHEDLRETSPSAAAKHPFSTPDGNKTYCKTCGYTQAAGNHPGEAGERWGTAQLQQDFTVVGFAAPYVVVVRKSDGKKGTLEFTHSPRTYFGWQEDGS